MANRKSFSCCNIGWWQLALVVVCLGGVLEGRAQVPNDDCGTALNVTPPDLSTQCRWPIGIPGYSTPIVDSTDFALVDLPYPIGTAFLLGYPGFTVGPADDMWFKAWGRYGYSWQIDSPDTCHVSIWAGGGCSNLVSYRNYGIASGTVSGSTCGAFQPNDTIYFQVSNRSVGAESARFHMCLTSACAQWIGASFTYNDPTLVACFLDSVVLEPCSDPSSSDGEIHVQVNMGNGPFTILWNDGDESFNRTALDTGVYVYRVTDVDGCMESDTVHLGNQISTSVSPVVRDMNTVDVVPNPARDGATLMLGNPLEKAGTFILLNSIGKEVIRLDVPAAEYRTSFSTSGLATGVYHYRVVNSNGLIGNGRLSIIR